MKWFTDSIERGMVLDETLYHPLLPQEQQGVGAWNRTVPPAKEKAAEAENSSNPRPRKLRRIASTKLVDQNEGIWGAIVGSGFENNELRRSTNSQPKSDNLTSSKIARRASVVQEVKSFASETTFAEGQGSRQDTSEVRPANNNGFLDGCYFFIYGFSPKQVCTAGVPARSDLTVADQCTASPPLIQWSPARELFRRVLAPWDS